MNNDTVMDSALTRLPYLAAKRIWQLLYHGVSNFGNRIGCDALTYNYGVFLSFHRTARLHAPRVADAYAECFPSVRSFADVGCGTGAYAAEFQRRGYKVLACEYAGLARRWCRKQGVAAVPFDLSKSPGLMPGTPVDLAYSFEVGEHIPEPFAEAFVEYLSKTGKMVTLTCAHPGQGGQGHVNEQPKSYWIEKFTRRGWTHDEAISITLARKLLEKNAADFLANNMMVFRR